MIKGFDSWPQLTVLSAIDIYILSSNIYSTDNSDAILSGNSKKSTEIVISIYGNEICIIYDPIRRFLPPIPSTYMLLFLTADFGPKYVQYST